MKNMPIEPKATEDRTPRRDVLAIYVLRALYRAQSAGRQTSLEEVSLTVGARKADVRSIVSTLHGQGHVDAVRMRLTLSGFAIASALRGKGLRQLRPDASATSGADRLTHKPVRVDRAA